MSEYMIQKADDQIQAGLNERENLLSQISTLREIVEILKKANTFYASKKNWGYNDYPKNQRHLAWMIENHDCGWCPENEKFVGGKLARSTQKQVEELEKKLEEKCEEKD